MAKKNNQSDPSEDRQFFEIVNWKKSQPKMKKGGAQWMKLYTSLLFHEGFLGLPSIQQMNIVALWLYAAVSGHHILPADPKWLFQRIPLLREPLDLNMLAETVDTFGNHNPFIKFCDPPKSKKTSSIKTDREREREKESREKNPTGSRKKDRENKERVIKPQKKEQKAENPKNPKKSEARSVKVHHLPRPTRSVFNRGPQRIGVVLADWLPEHWRDPDAQEFGWEIVEALGYERNEQNMEIRSEWGAFAKFWMKVKARASPMILGEIRRKAVEKARFVNSPKAKSARNKSAVWTKIMYGELSKIGISIKGLRSG